MHSFVFCPCRRRRNVPFRFRSVSAHACTAGYHYSLPDPCTVRVLLSSFARRAAKRSDRRRRHTPHTSAFAYVYVPRRGKPSVHAYSETMETVGGLITALFHPLTLLQLGAVFFTNSYTTRYHRTLSQRFVSPRTGFSSLSDSAKSTRCTHNTLA